MPRRETVHLRFWLFLSVLCMLLAVSSLRGIGTGADDRSYLEMYNQIPGIFELYGFDSSVLEAADLGYILLNSVCKSLGVGVNGVFFLVTLISLICIARAMSLVGVQYPIVGYIIFFSHVFLYRETMQLRAAVSYSIVLYAFVLFACGRKWRSLAAILIASTFHFTAFVALVIFLVPIRRRYSATLLVSAVGVAIVFSLLIGKAALLAAFSVLAFLNPGKFNSYLLDTAGWVYSLGLTNPTLVKQIFIWGVFLILRDRLRGAGRGIDALLNIYLISILMLIVFKDFAVFAARFASLFSYVEVVFVPLLIMAFRPKHRFYALMSIIGIYFLILIMNIYVKGVKSDYFPFFI